MKKFSYSLAAFACIAILAGCFPKEEFNQIGKDIKFSARTRSSIIATKTVYSGETVTGGDAHTNKVERIDWENGDIIKVISEQAESPGESEYALTPETEPNGKFRYATADPTAADGHGLQWGEGSHIFYAMYPGPSTSGAQSGLGITTDSNGYGVVSVSLPADQSISTTRPSKSESGDSHNYYGDMRLAYMTAATIGAPSSDPIMLSFTPIVTTFYVTVKNTTGKAMTLRRVALSSTRDALSGDFTATLFNVSAISESYANEPDYVNYNCTFTLPNYSSSNSTVYAEFGENGLSLAATDSVVVALFAQPRPRPQFISELTLAVTSDETGEVRLPLKQNGNWLQFTGCNKHNINNVQVPDVEYVLEVDKTLLQYDNSGTGTSAQQFTVTSKKTFNTASPSYEKPANWKTQIYDSDNSRWVDLEGNCPTWLKNFPLDQTGRTTATSSISDAPATYHTYLKDVEEQPVTSHVNKLKSNKVYDAEGNEFDNKTNRSDAIDLSKYNFISRRKENLRTTANTYVVAAPGWYKIPMVYGNLIERGSTVANACKGTGWHLGHLDYFKKAPLDENIYLGVNYPWLRHDYLDHCRVYWEIYTSYNGTTATTTGTKISDQTPAPSGIIKNVSMEVSEEFIYFEVDDQNIKPGNFLIATFNDDDDCCWSWHIWITDQNMKLVDFDGNSVLPVNIGWIDDTEGQYYDERSSIIKFVSTEKAGLESEEVTVIQPYYERLSTSGWQTYYQWGRKDPLTDAGYGVTTVKKDDRAINGSIKHPTQIQYDESTFGSDEYYDWTSANYNNLWDSQNNLYGTASSALPDHKTVYDPSPRGFSVPPDNAWDNLGSYYEIESGGVKFYTSSSKQDSLFFPSSGCLAFTTATLTDAGSGFYWTIRPGERANRRASFSLRFSKGASSVTMYPKQYAAVGSFEAASRAFGYAVRPVLYDVSVVPSDDIEGSQMQEMIFANLFAATDDDLDGDYVESGDIRVSFSRPNGLSANKPSYNASTGLVALPNSSSSLSDYTTAMTVSAKPGVNLNIIKVVLFFADSDGGSPAISAVSSPEDGGGYADGKGTEGRNGLWQIDGYSGGTFNPNANSVTFKTGLSNDVRYLTGLSVVYKK